MLDYKACDLFLLIKEKSKSPNQNLANHSPCKRCDGGFNQYQSAPSLSKPKKVGGTFVPFSKLKNRSGMKPMLGFCNLNRGKKKDIQ